jgi:hypothetical protein
MIVLIKAQPLFTAIDVISLLFMLAVAHEDVTTSSNSECMALGDSDSNLGIWMIQSASP